MFDLSRNEVEQMIYSQNNGTNVFNKKYIGVYKSIQKYIRAWALRSMNTGQLVEPRVQTKHGEAEFSSYAAHNWNKLPVDIRCAPNISFFKSRLKTLPFSHKYDETLKPHC